MEQSIQPIITQVVRRAAEECPPSLRRLYQGLKTSSVSTMVRASTPTLERIKNTVSETDARALLTLAVCEVCDFFNVGKNMTDTQVAMTVDFIIQEFSYMKLEEIKACFHKAMLREKLYDRLDGGIILGWLREYDATRDEVLERINIEEKKQLEMSTAKPCEGAMSFDDYVSYLREKSARGDKDAEAKLTIALENKSKRRTVDDRKRKDEEFKRYYREVYLPGRMKRQQK